MFEKISSLTSDLYGISLSSRKNAVLARKSLQKIITEARELRVKIINDVIKAKNYTEED